MNHRQAGYTVPEIPNGQVDDSGRAHTITEKRTPTRITLSCSCGWKWDTLILNGSGSDVRESKVKAGQQRHLRDIKPRKFK